MTGFVHRGCLLLGLLALCRFFLFFGITPHLGIILLITGPATWSRRGCYVLRSTSFEGRPLSRYHFRIFWSLSALGEHLVAVSFVLYIPLYYSLIGRFLLCRIFPPYAIYLISKNYDVICKDFDYYLHKKRKFVFLCRILSRDCSGRDRLLLRLGRTWTP